MAQRLKTIEYWFPELETLADLTDTNFTQITLYVPEDSVDLVFRSVVLEIIIQDGATTVANINRRQSSIQLGAAGYSAVNNTNIMTASGEQKWVSHSADFTSYFNTNWSGTSMTCDARLLIDSAGTAVWKCATAKLTVTYEYNDSATTHIKTVRLPLNAPFVQLTTTQPGTSTDTFPALDSWLPEASAVVRQTSIVIQGNQESAATTDMTLSMRLDSATTRTTQTHEKGSNAASWYRHVWQPSFDTATTHDFYLWASATDFDHPQIWMVITYEFDESSTTTVLNSLLLPMEFESPMGGPTSSDYQRATREVWIQEPETITIQECALYLHWDQAAAISGGVGARVGTGSFNMFTSVAATLAGGCGGMIRCESEIGSLSRGSNTLQADIYRTDSTNLGWNVSSWWIINYTSSRYPDGVGAHNHTVCWNLFAHGTTTADNNRTTSALSITIPETDWFMNALGLNYQYLTNTSGNAAGVVVQVERLVAEGGTKWETIYSDIAHTDAEQGIRQIWATARQVFKRWPEEPDTDRIAVQTDRRYKAYLSQGANSWDHLDLWFTYHSIVYHVIGGLSAWEGDGSGAYVRVWRSNVSTTLSLIREVVTDVGGVWSIVWYDNTDPITATGTQPAHGLVCPHFDFES
jgi:hypothetical protein